MVKNKRKVRTLARFDASVLIGFPVVVLDAVEEIDEGAAEGPGIAIPRIEDLAAAAAVARCQMAPRLRGGEIKALRGLLDMMQADLSAALGGGVAVETISRWEKEARDAGDHLEKLLRLLVCERLKSQAAGIAYQPAAVIGLTLADRQSRMAPMEFRYVKVRTGRSIEERWTTTAAAPAASKAAA